MAAKPVVDGLEREFAGRLEVLRVDIQSAAGKDLQRVYGAFTPTFVLFDAAGEEMWRMVGSLDADAVRASLSAP